MSKFKFSLESDFNLLKSSDNLYREKDSLGYYCCIINCEILQTIVPVSDIVQGFWESPIGTDLYECAINEENFPFGNRGYCLLGKRRYKEIVSGLEYGGWYPIMTEQEIVKLCQYAVDGFLKDTSYLQPYKRCKFKTSLLNSRTWRGNKKRHPSWKYEIKNHHLFDGGKYKGVIGKEYKERVEKRKSGKDYDKYPIYV